MLNKWVLASYGFFLLLTPIIHAVETSFQIVAIPDKAEYNRGEVASVTVFIDGRGKLEKGKIYFYAPPYLIKEGTIIEAFGDFYCGPYSTLTEEDIKFLNESERFGQLNLELPYTGQCCFPLNIIKDDKRENSFSVELVETPLSCPTDETFWNKFIEIDGKEYPPFKIYFNLSKDAPDGNTPIYFSFAYEKNGEYPISTNIANIRIRTWYERWEWTLILIGVLTAISIIVPNGMPKLIKKIWKDCKGD